MCAILKQDSYARSATEIPEYDPFDAIDGQSSRAALNILPEFEDITSVYSSKETQMVHNKLTKNCFTKNFYIYGITGITG